MRLVLVAITTLLVLHTGQQEAMAQNFHVSSAGGNFFGMAQTVRVTPYAYDLGTDVNQNYVLAASDSFSISHVNNVYDHAEAQGMASLDTGVSDILFAVSNFAARGSNAQSYGSARSSMLFSLVFSVPATTELFLRFNATGLPDDSYEIDNYSVTLGSISGSSTTTLFSRSAAENSFDADGDGVFYTTTLAAGTNYRLDLSGTFLNDGAGQANGSLSFSPTPVPEPTGALVLLLGGACLLLGRGRPHGTRTAA